MFSEVSACVSLVCLVYFFVRMTGVYSFLTGVLFVNSMFLYSGMHVTQNRPDMITHHLKTIIEGGLICKLISSKTRPDLYTRHLKKKGKSLMKTSP